MGHQLPPLGRGVGAFQQTLTVAVAVAVAVAVGILLAFVIGKLVGIFAAAYTVARFTRADLDENLSWLDVLGLALLGGIGFTV